MADSRCQADSSLQPAPDLPSRTVELRSQEARTIAGPDIRAETRIADRTAGMITTVTVAARGVEGTDLLRVTCIPIRMSSIQASPTGLQLTIPKMSKDRTPRFLPDQVPITALNRRLRDTPMHIRNRR